MRLLEHIFENARKSLKHIVLAEGEDERVLAAAVIASKQGLAKVTLLGNVGIIGKNLTNKGVSHYIHSIIDPCCSNKLADYAAALKTKRKYHKYSMEDALNVVKSPLVFAAIMVDQGDADGTLAGAVETTADTVRQALHIIGKNKNSKIVSSFFLMLGCAKGSDLAASNGFEGGMIFADCALQITPNSSKLAEIAIQSASSCQNLIGEQPRIAMLSFSSNGSAEHKLVDKVKNAVTIVQTSKPQLVIDGEIQFDAAFNNEIRTAKMPNSLLAQRPNIFVFPNLEAGNIGYKIAQQLGGLQAIGPILQGLAKPANDLSRGCSVDDIVVMIAVTSVQANTQI